MIRAAILALLVSNALSAQRSVAEERPLLFFREDWKQTPAALPVTQEHVANDKLILSLHGPGKDGVKKSHHDTPKDDPYYIWNGDCAGNWAVSLRHKESMMDLRGLAKIRWRAKQQGFHFLRILIKLADGTWLVSDAEIGRAHV